MSIYVASDNDQRKLNDFLIQYYWVAAYCGITVLVC